MHLADLFKCPLTSPWEYSLTHIVLFPMGIVYSSYLFLTYLRRHIVKARHVADVTGCFILTKHCCNRRICATGIYVGQIKESKQSDAIASNGGCKANCEKAKPRRCRGLRFVLHGAGFVFCEKHIKYIIYARCFTRR